MTTKAKHTLELEDNICEACGTNHEAVLNLSLAVDNAIERLGKSITVGDLVNDPSFAMAVLNDVRKNLGTANKAFRRQDD